MGGTSRKSDYWQRERSVSIFSVKECRGIRAVSGNVGVFQLEKKPVQSDFMHDGYD
jgi:hypothetical protein